MCDDDVLRLKKLSQSSGLNIQMLLIQFFQAICSFKWSSDTLMIEIEIVPKTSASFEHLRLVARQDFINSVRPESFISYNMFLRRVHTVSKPRKTLSSSPPLKPQISHKYIAPVLYISFWNRFLPFQISIVYFYKSLMACLSLFKSCTLK